MSQKFQKLKRESKIHIINNKNTSNRKLMAEIIEKFNNPVSYKYIGNFKNSNNFSQLSSQISQKIPKKISSTGDQKNNGKTKKKKDLGQKLAYFSQVINSIHINAHPPQKKLLKYICGDNDILTVREWIISRYTEALTN